MSIALGHNTRTCLDNYFARQAQINNVSVSTLTKRFSVDPAVQQRLENASMQSSEFLNRINVIGVNDQEGEKVLLGSTGPIARTNNTTTTRRNPATAETLEAERYRCEQVNYDTAISYQRLDAWAAHPDFQSRVSNQVARQIALDRIMCGFNGTLHATISDFAANPLLQDVNTGWLELIRKNAAARVISGTITSRDEDNKIIAKGTWGNIDAAAMDVRNSLMDEWYKESPDLVVLVGRDMLNSARLPTVNALSQTNPNTELLAGQLIATSGLVGGMPAYIAPFFPKDGLLVTAFSNLSIYYQLGAMRRLIREEPEYNRIAFYQSSNDAYVVEDYGMCAFIDGLKFAEAEADNTGE